MASFYFMCRLCKVWSKILYCNAIIFTICCYTLAFPVTDMIGLPYLCLFTAVPRNTFRLILMLHLKNVPSYFFSCIWK